MFHDRVVQRLIAFFLADLNHARDLVRFSFAHKVRDGGVDDQNFERGDATRLVDALEKILRNYDLERFGEGGANLILLRGRKDIDDTVDRVGRVGRAQSAVSKIAGWGRGTRELNRSRR